MRTRDKKNIQLLGRPPPRPMGLNFHTHRERRELLLDYSTLRPTWRPHVLSALFKNIFIDWAERKNKDARTRTSTNPPRNPPKALQDTEWYQSSKDYNVIHNIALYIKQNWYMYLAATWLKVGPSKTSTRSTSLDGLIFVGRHNRWNDTSASTLSGVLEVVFILVFFVIIFKEYDAGQIDRRRSRDGQRSRLL